MLIHRPGQPQDLPDPEEMWARWAFAAVLCATSEREGQRSGLSGWWLDAARGGLRMDDRGCTWWALWRWGEGRFLLCGWDESGELIGFEPPVDMFAGAPQWLSPSRLEELVDPFQFGCVYWYEHGRWSRAPYPDELWDDGLDIGLNSALDLEAAADLRRIDVARLKADIEELNRAATHFRVTERQLCAFADRAVASGASSLDVPAMLRALDASGLGKGAETETG
ncbi:hypothetical protein [Streptomyces sp. 891-h]|uniref:hypothetical protein n=1 Tax=Streptomyces sp. 891-h TaxID=2720714 RepID=UPI001FA9651C|nr:hypothetical protein [Streptomyces sp. 891-h]UNZ15832.1 hypothetical protein HC362_00740 [Streptomyces sp. 891-h]